MIRVRVQWKIEAPFETVKFETCPRVDEYVIRDDKRFRVCQVVYRSIEGTYWPCIILQEEIR